MESEPKAEGGVASTWIEEVKDASEGFANAQDAELADAALRPGFKPSPIIAVATAGEKKTTAGVPAIPGFLLDDLPLVFPHKVSARLGSSIVFA
jgi:hypothetical protein